MLKFWIVDGEFRRQQSYEMNEEDPAGLQPDMLFSMNSQQLDKGDSHFLGESLEGTWREPTWREKPNTAPQCLRTLFSSVWIHKGPQFFVSRPQKGNA